MKIDGKKAIEKVAKVHGFGVEEIRTQMDFAIKEGINNPDLKVQKFWKQVPCSGERPTPEELIEFLMGKMKI